MDNRISHRRQNNMIKITVCAINPMPAILLVVLQLKQPQGTRMAPMILLIILDMKRFDKYFFNPFISLSRVQMQFPPTVLAARFNWTPASGA